MTSFSFKTRLGYELLWISRMLARREDLFLEFEMTLEQLRSRELDRLGDTRNQEREKIPVIDIRDFRPETFRRVYKDRTPLVIRGLGRDTAAAKQWSPDYFAEHYGDTVVEVRDAPRERVGSPDNYNAAGYVAMTLRDYIGGQMRSESSQMYLGAMSELFKAHPELMDDLGIGELDAMMGVKVIRPEIFMGTSKNHTPWHCAGIDNYFLQIHGEKEWHFINPAYTAGLYLKASAMVFGAPGLFSNVIPGDDRLFPLYQKTPQYTATLAPGDFLYNPAYWWHEVTNIGETIGCALRVVAEGAFGHFLVLDKFLLGTSFLNPRMLMSNIQLTLNHFMPSRTRERLYFSDHGPRKTVPIKQPRGPSYVEARRTRLDAQLTAGAQASELPEVGS